MMYTEDIAPISPYSSLDEQLFIPQQELFEEVMHLSEPAIEMDTKQDLGSQFDLEIIVLHKPRTANGAWQAVEEDDSLRVTKTRGKWFRLEIKGTFDFTCKDLCLCLLEAPLILNEPEVLTKLSMDQIDEKDKINIPSHSKEITMRHKEIDIKVDKINPKLQFWAKVSCGERIFYGKSPQFTTHNNGKAKGKEETATPIKSQSKRKIESVPTSLPMPPIPQLASLSSPSSEEAEQLAAINPFHINDINNYNLNNISYDTTFPYINNNNNTNINNNNINHSSDDYINTENNGEYHVNVNTQSIESDKSMLIRNNLYAHGFLQTSDMRLKTDIQEIEDAMKYILQLEGKTFYWKNNEYDNQVPGKRIVGFIAQEVRRVLPHVVHEDPVTGLLSVSYVEILPILIEAFKQQNDEHNKLKMDVQNQLDILRNQIDDVKRSSERRRGEFTRKQSPAEIQKVVTSFRYFALGKCLHIFPILMFLTGVAMVLFSCILLGTHYFGASQTLTIEILSAKGLKTVNETAPPPDPFCQFTLGKHHMRTNTVWNDYDPYFEDRFKIDLSPQMNNITFQLFDDNTYPYFPRNIGNVTLMLSVLTPGEEFDNWLTITDSNGLAAGELHVTLQISKQQPIAVNIVLIVAGSLLILASAFLASRGWRLRCR